MARSTHCFMAGLGISATPWLVPKGSRSEPVEYGVMALIIGAFLFGDYFWAIDRE